LELQTYRRPRTETANADPARVGTEDDKPELTVYFDGACPVCTREIGFYRRQPGAERVNWVDAASCPATDLGSDLEREAALKKFHVRRADGSLVTGAAGFAAIWQRLPRFVWLGRIASWRPVQQGLDWGYAGFLRLRRWWRPSPDTGAEFRASVVADLRTDHAGETGAVVIYQGILAVARDPEVRAFATRHLETERKHLKLIETSLPPAEHSRLLPVWRIAGWLTGAVPALAGPAAVYATVAAVETFVDRHYQEQIERLAGHEEFAGLRATLAACREEEITHRDEAASHAEGSQGVFLRGWTWLVGAGSAAAVHLARRI
jgi:demethoxyubiquinone hydroxylase (CLK1/Coq7/Cat5 family)